MLRHAAWMARHLGRGDLFPFTPGEVADLAATIGVEEVEPGTRLLATGGPVEFIGIIERGEVELSQRSGLRRVVLKILRDGDLLGDVPFFCRLPAPFTARALAQVMLIRLDRRNLDRLLAARPALAQRFLYSPGAWVQQAGGQPRPEGPRGGRADPRSYRRIEVIDVPALERIAAG